LVCVKVSRDNAIDRKRRVGTLEPRNFTAVDIKPKGRVVLLLVY